MKNRILSIDVLRGITIFLMIVVNTPGSWKYVWSPLRHAEWHGCTLTDLVFPGFLFVVGLSMSVSFRKYDGRGTGPILLKIIKRTSIIFILGLLLNYFPFFHKELSSLRIFGVLQRIALSFLLASLLLILSKHWKFILISTIGLMLLHWFILYQYESPDPYALASNIATQIDLFIVGDAHMYHGYGQAFDPEGLLGTLTGAAQILLGYLIGYQVTSKEVDNDTITFLVVLGAVLIGLGLLWNKVLPINKPLWTGSYVIFTTGILACVFYALVRLIDLMKKTRWTLPFRVFGLNPLISYILSGVLVRLLLFVFRTEDQTGYAWIYENVFQVTFGDYGGSLAFALSATGLIYLIAYVMYKKGIVVKI